MTVAPFRQHNFLGNHADDATAQTAVTTRGWSLSAGMFYYNTTSKKYRFYDGSVWADVSAGGAGNTLDQAYDQGGAGAGRQITGDSGAVEVVVPLAVASGEAVKITLNNNVTGLFHGLWIDGTVMTGAGKGIPVMVRLSYPNFSGAGVAYGIYLEPSSPNAGNPIYVDTGLMTIGEVINIEDTVGVVVTGTFTGLKINFASTNPSTFAVVGINLALPSLQPSIILNTHIRMHENNDPTTPANSGALYTKDVAGVTQLFYREDSSGTVHQITPTGGKSDFGTSLTGQPLVSRYVSYEDTLLLQNLFNNAQRHTCVDSNGNRYFGYIDNATGLLFIVKIQPNFERHIYETPYTPDADFTIQINSADEIVMAYGDLSDLYITKNAVATLSNLGSWTAPIQVNVAITGTSYGVVSAIDSQDRIWLAYHDAIAVGALYYAVYNTAPSPMTVVQVETLVGVTPTATAFCLEIDSNDYCHLAFLVGVLPNGNVQHTFATTPVGGFGVPVNLVTQNGVWWALSMVITSTDRVIVGMIDGLAGNYYASYIDSPYAVSGMDPPRPFDTDPYMSPISELSTNAHMLSINDVGDIMHCVRSKFDNLGLELPVLAIYRTDASLTFDDVVGSLMFVQVYNEDIEQLNVHWANYNHNRPDYDYPFIVIQKQKMYYTSSLTVEVYYPWEELGE